MIYTRNAWNVKYTFFDGNEISPVQIFLTVISRLQGRDIAVYSLIKYFNYTAKASLTYIMKTLEWL